MKYLLQISRNLQPENAFLNATLNFRDQDVQNSFKTFQKKLNKCPMIFIETFKMFLELALTISAIFKDNQSVESQILIVFPLSSLLQIWSIQRNSTCNDYWKIIHVVTILIYLSLYVDQFMINGYVQLYYMYVTQSLNNKKYLICYFTIMQFTYLYFDNIFDWILLPFEWIFILAISISIYLRERRKLICFFEKFNFSHDLSYQEVVLNHSLQQNLFVIKLNSDQNMQDQFEVLFVNQACNKEFATIESIYQKINQIQIINCNESNISLCNLKVNLTQELILNNLKATGEQINMIDNPQSLNYILYQYMSNSQDKELQESLPLKLTGLMYNNHHQTYDILVSPCIWKYQKSFVVSLIEITDRIKISQLEKLDQYKDSVLATVSHDLKNPIGVVQSMITLVQDKILEKIQSCCNYLEMCQTNVQILQSFVNDLQDFSQIKQQKLKLAISEFDILQLIQDVKNVFRIQTQKKNLQLEIVSILKSTQILNNDPLRIKQVLFNLLSNAIKFTSKGKISIIFSDEPMDICKFCINVKDQININKSVVDVDPLIRNQQRLILCTVYDSGSGITQEIQRRLFRNFATYDDDNNTNKNGVGLGLIICKQLCGYIGPLQYIYLESQVGVGSTFQFVIYKNYDKQQHHQQQDQFSVDSIDYDVSVHSPYKNMISTNQLAPFHKKINKKEKLQVLIVDDESFNNMLLKIQLSKIGIYKVDTAFGGQIAIDMVLKQRYDVVFLDFNMPGMNGLQCINEIKRISPTTKIYMLTAFNDMKTQQNCLSAGADKILQKPPTSQDLKLLFI
ncbi:unnamed protein product (macronuclear) [Paramecium tetraurelia]|uniref:Histidine kinase n=1 Tax=Paramecium tetraurelia TaxID=5888 RepID=A0C8L6_PARTE|nr:uncharacterized protein GSPATT00036267001 [Paramecium tetraurelia]CAK67133.1 unnamed protein product [Paramecium tetraurelia]|eukprot:XP_001434530.1 hypothetical protein (macronuclear) [Paramecium tetraurelia strain d4-2]